MGFSEHGLVLREQDGSGGGVPDDGGAPSPGPMGGHQSNPSGNPTASDRIPGREPNQASPQPGGRMSIDGSLPRGSGDDFDPIKFLGDKYTTADHKWTPEFLSANPHVAELAKSAYHAQRKITELGTARSKLQNQLESMQGGAISAEAFQGIVNHFEENGQFGDEHRSLLERVLPSEAVGALERQFKFSQRMAQQFWQSVYNKGDEQYGQGNTQAAIQWANENLAGDDATLLQALHSDSLRDAAIQAIWEKYSASTGATAHSGHQAATQPQPLTTGSQLATAGDVYRSPQEYVADIKDANRLNGSERESAMAKIRAKQQRSPVLNSMGQMGDPLGIGNNGPVTMH